MGVTLEKEESEKMMPYMLITKEKKSKCILRKKEQICVYIMSAQDWLSKSNGKRNNFQMSARTYEQSTSTKKNTARDKMHEDVE